MATLLTTVKLNKLAVAASVNKLVLSSKIDWSLSDEFKEKDTPIGDSINIPRPVLGNVVADNMAFTSGAGEVVQAYSTLIVNATATAFLTFSEFNLALQGSPEGFLKKFGGSIGSQMASSADSRLYDALINAGANLKSTAFNGGGMPVLGNTTLRTPTNPGAQWVVYGSGVTTGVASPSHATPGALVPFDLFRINQILDDSACPADERYGILTPVANMYIADAQAKYFNPTVDASKVMRQGYIGTVAGIEWAVSQTPGTHTNGLWAGTLRTDTTAISANSTWTENSSITLTGVTATTTMNAGDMFTVGGGGTGIFWVNPLSKQSTGQLIQFTVQTAVASAATTQALVVSPAIITAGPYQNCVIVTKASETVTLLGAAGATYQESVVFQKEAIKGAAPKLFTDPSDKNASYARELETNIGIRMMTTFDILGAAAGLNGVPKRITRMDMIFGIKVFRPEWCVRIRTAIPA